MRIEPAISTSKQFEHIFRIVMASRRSGENLQLILDTNYHGDTLVNHCINVYITSQDEAEKERLRAHLKQLLDLGANPNEWDSQNRMPALHRAIRLKDQALVDMILTSTKLDYSSKQHEYYKTALKICIEVWPENVNLAKQISQNNNNELQDLFLEAINEAEFDQEETEDNPEVLQHRTRIQFFISNQLIDFNVPDSEGRLPLHLLCVMGDISLLNFVLHILAESKLEIDFNQRDDKGNSALHFACHPSAKTQANIIKWLLENKVDPNQPNQSGEYPLHYVVALQNPLLVNLLLEHNASPSSRDRLGRTALGRILTRPEIQAGSAILALLMSADKTTAPIDIPPWISPIQLSYEQGFWIRRIGAYGRHQSEAVKREVDILKRRESMSDADLDAHHPTVNIKKHPHYVFSPATFVKAGLNASLFGSEKFELVIQTPRKIPAWCSGHAGEIVTDRGADISFTAKNLKFKYEDKYQLISATTAEIGLREIQLTTESIKRYFPGFDTYDLCKFGPSNPRYNEGLFRYRKEHIAALVIKMKNPASAFYALQFCRLAELPELPFIEYKRGSIATLNSADVAALAAQFREDDHSTSRRYDVFSGGAGAAGDAAAASAAASAAYDDYSAAGAAAGSAGANSGC